MVIITIDPKPFFSSALVLVLVHDCTRAFLLWFRVLPQLFVTSHSKLLVELQSLRTELDRSIYHRVALIPLLDRFPESKLVLVSGCSAADSRSSPVPTGSRKLHKNKTEGQKVQKQHGSGGPGPTRDGGVGQVGGMSATLSPAGTSPFNKASILPGNTPEYRQGLQQPSSSEATPQVLRSSQSTHLNR